MKTIYIPNKSENATHIFLLKIAQPFPKQAPVFMCLQYESFENTTGKEEIARDEHFLHFSQSFLPVSRRFCHFDQI